jgi:hypothetical protein
MNYWKLINSCHKYNLYQYVIYVASENLSGRKKGWKKRGKDVGEREGKRGRKNSIIPIS